MYIWLYQLKIRMFSTNIQGHCLASGSFKNNNSKHYLLQTLVHNLMWLQKKKQPWSKESFLNILMKYMQSDIVFRSEQHIINFVMNLKMEFRLPNIKARFWCIT